MDILTTIMGGTLLNSVSGLATMTTLIVQVLKNILPKKIPTQVLTLIVSFLVVFGFTAITSEFTIPIIIGNIFNSFVVGFISMFGFDTFKELKCRFQTNKEGDEIEDENIL